MRVTVLLLVGLVTLSAVFDLDIVLGAFAAGFVLRYIIPEGNDSLEKKLDGLAYGFLIPVFFVVSGAKINLMAVFAQPLLLVGFIVHAAAHPRRARVRGAFHRQGHARPVARTTA